MAQNSSLSFLEVHHNLGEVPALVEVLVKSVSEPNKDFIFKGIDISLGFISDILLVFALLK